MHCVESSSVKPTCSQEKTIALRIKAWTLTTAWPRNLLSWVFKTFILSNPNAMRLVRQSSVEEPCAGLAHYLSVFPIDMLWWHLGVSGAAICACQIWFLAWAYFHYLNVANIPCWVAHVKGELLNSSKVWTADFFTALSRKIGTDSRSASLPWDMWTP